MATIKSRLLFLTTSPRTPEKMIPEIALLTDKFAGQKWSPATQTAFMEQLRAHDFFCGSGEKDPAFSARDRITRAPKALGFVSLTPFISLTEAGKALVSAKRTDEIFLRQMLKFQIPSPYHKPAKEAVHFCIKPYLEMLRLVSVLGVLRFDELQIFGMQLTDWHNFDATVRKIERYRSDKEANTGNYKQFKARQTASELREVYRERIASGQTKTRESRDMSVDKFIDTQKSNMRDYADACFRYLRATGLVEVSHIGKSLSIMPDKQADVDYILTHVSRTPATFATENEYVSYLGNAGLPELYTDDKSRLLEKLRAEFPDTVADTRLTTAQLKELIALRTDTRKQKILERQTSDLKTYRLYGEIQNTFDQITGGNLYDAPLIFEWNTWRAMTMLDGGTISANLKFDDHGQPLSTARGNMPDIICDYGDFMLTVEVTISTGQRHLVTGAAVTKPPSIRKRDCGKPCFCLFVAPAVNEACIAHFFALGQSNISYYGGKSLIVPLRLESFRKLLRQAATSGRTPVPQDVRRLFDFARDSARSSADEVAWYQSIERYADSWLADGNCTA